MNAFDSSPTKLLMCHKSLGRPDDDERREIDALVTRVRELEPDEVLAHQMVETHLSAILTDGLLARYVVGPNGARQMVSLHLPGDFVDLHGMVLKRLDHEIVAMTPARVALIPHAGLEALIAKRPELARKLWFLTLNDAAMHRSWLYRVARTDAYARVANFLCEMNLRCMAIGASDGRVFQLPVRQQEIGEICGVTAIHINRILRLMREEGICTFRKHVVTIHQPGKLCTSGQFNPDYLYYDQALIERFEAVKEVSS